MSHFGLRNLAPLLTAVAVLSPAASAAQAPPPVIEQSIDLNELGIPQMAQVSISPGGVITFFDPMRGELRLIAPNGGPRSTIPGASSVLGWLGDTAAVRGVGEQLVLYTADGTLVRTVPADLSVAERAATTGLLATPTRQAIGAGDTVAIYARVQDHVRSEPTQHLYAVQGVAWWQAAKGGRATPMLSIPEPACTIRTPFVKDPLGYVPTPYCGPGTGMAILPGQHLAYLVNDQRSAERASFTLVVLRSNGDTVMASTFERPPTAITDSMWEAALQHRFFQRSASALRNATRPAVLPSATHVIPIDADGVWIGLRPDGLGREWWLVDLEGVHTASVTLPNVATVISATEDRIVAVVSDPGSQRLVTYRVPTP